LQCEVAFVKKLTLFYFKLPFFKSKKTEMINTGKVEVVNSPFTTLEQAQNRRMK
jgi:hypothetical protein